MKNYVVYDHMSGEIRSWGASDMPPETSDDQHRVVWDCPLATPATHYVLGGVLTAYTTGQAAAKAQAPSYSALWDNAAFKWVDLRNLEDAKAETWTQIKADRDAEIYGGFVWDGSKFDTDPISISRVQGAVQLATIAMSQGQPFSIDWTLFDNSTRTLSATEMVQVGVALGVFVTTIFAAGVTLRDQINAATTLDQVDAIKWVNIF